jgi:3-deoxy-D-manno-octulosonic-acid transferase
MQFLYSFGVRIYGLIIRLASLFNQKAKLWIHGRQGLINDLEVAFEKARTGKPASKTAWFHCASLGEFEQGRPLIESFRQQHPEYLILLTFFSPSGYENRKNYQQADLIYYLPLDTRSNAEKFLDIVKPDIIFFIKYEFWFNYLGIIQDRKIPHYLISAIFRADQHFFKWYGDWSRKILMNFTHIFVQNEISKELLEFVGITNVSVSGDTRFDRVISIASSQKDLPVIESFCKDSTVLVAGSTWPADEKLLVKFASEYPGKIKMIIAPHELHEDALTALTMSLGPSAVRYSKIGSSALTEKNILVLDAIGILSKVYSFGKIAYVGGGFGAGIHNILEAAVYGLPVIMGPNINKFHEAIELTGLKGAYIVHHYSDFSRLLNGLIDDPSRVSKAGITCRTFVDKEKGATGRILAEIKVP